MFEVLAPHLVLVGLGQVVLDMIDISGFYGQFRGFFVKILLLKLWRNKKHSFYLQYFVQKTSHRKCKAILIFFVSYRMIIRFKKTYTIELLTEAFTLG